MARSLTAALGSLEALSATRCVRAITGAPPWRGAPAGSGCKPCPGRQQQRAPLPAGVVRSLLLPMPCKEIQWRRQPRGGVARGGCPACRRERQPRSPSVQVGMVVEGDEPSRSARIAGLGFEHRLPLQATHPPTLPACTRSPPFPAPGADCLAEEDGSVIVRDDLDALLQVCGCLWALSAATAPCASCSTPLPLLAPATSCHSAIIPPRLPALSSALQVLPADIREPLVNHPERASLLEVVLDLVRAACASGGAWGGRRHCGWCCGGSRVRLSWCSMARSCVAGHGWLPCRLSPALTLTSPTAPNLQGRRPEARFLGKPGGQFLREAEVGRKWAWPPGSGLSCCTNGCEATVPLYRCRTARWSPPACTAPPPSCPPLLPGKASACPASLLAFLPDHQGRPGAR